MLGNDEPVASVAGEVAPHEKYEFYDYESKYTAGQADLLRRRQRELDEVDAGDQEPAEELGRALDAELEAGLDEAAEILGVDRKTLYRKRDELSQNVPTGDNWDIH